MRLLRSFLVAGVMAASAVSASSAFAQSAADKTWYVAPTVSLTINDSARTRSEGVAGGGAVGKILSDHWNVELAGQYAAFGDKDNQASITLDGLYFIKRNKTFSPFITAGVGGVHEGPLPVEGRNRDLLLRGGVGFTTSVSSNIDFRMDARYQWHGSTGGAPNLGDVFVSAGLNIYFK
ncbi:outer membrane beta-barrel protein [Paraburkholderia acidisoli]|uniref:Outer membrane beta-barrel protein n=1 Tax=Paraburkholderia acidisoli TaxID=2571748 RepID=A0A7Z2GQK7_9BURK|nr:outer membrane beta-barrel protein [Paraburkholderia acidisoli]QGZ65920.1 outer membrane beta-barrel protein [Paraburkholderia acidisoli]